MTKFFTGDFAKRYIAISEKYFFTYDKMVQKHETEALSPYVTFY